MARCFPVMFRRINVYELWKICRGKNACIGCYRCSSTGFILTMLVVINYDLPNDPEDYVHRIGTGRAGASGVTVVSPVKTTPCRYRILSSISIIKFLFRNTNELLVTPNAPAKRERKHKPHQKKSAQKSNPQHKSGKPHHHKNKRKKPQNNKQHAAKPQANRKQETHNQKPKAASGNVKKKQSSKPTSQPKSVQQSKPGLIKTFISKFF